MESLEIIKNDLIEFFGNTIEVVRSELQSFIIMIFIIIITLIITLFVISMKQIDNLKETLDKQKIKIDNLELRIVTLEAKFDRWKYIQQSQKQ